MFSPPRLRAHRVAAGLTQADLADATGLSVASIGAYEQDRAGPSLRALGRLAAALGCTTDALMRRSSDPSSEYWDAVCAALPPLTGEEIDAVAGVLRRIDARLAERGARPDDEPPAFHYPVHSTTATTRSTH